MIESGFKSRTGYNGARTVTTKLQCNVNLATEKRLKKPVQSVTNLRDLYQFDEFLKTDGLLPVGCLKISL